MKILQGIYLGRFKEIMYQVLNDEPLTAQDKEELRAMLNRMEL